MVWAEPHATEICRAFLPVYGEDENRRNWHTRPGQRRALSPSWTGIFRYTRRRCFNPWTGRPAAPGKHTPCYGPDRLPNRTQGTRWPGPAIGFAGAKGDRLTGAGGRPLNCKIGVATPSPWKKADLRGVAGTQESIAHSDNPGLRPGAKEQWLPSFGYHLLRDRSGSLPTSTSSTIPFRTAQITSCCLVTIPNLS